MHLGLQPADISSKPAIADMLQPYLRELAPYYGGTTDLNTIHEYPYLDAYWQEPNQRYPFLMLTDGEIAGFAFVNRYSRLDIPDTWCVAEFYVVPRFRRSGVGKLAAAKLFRLFPGRWEVAILEGNVRAEPFWKRAITELVGEQWTEHRTDDWNGSILSFEVTDD